MIQLAVIGVLLVVLFYLLGRVADIVVASVRRVSAVFRVHVFFLGMLLGVVTSLPEFAIGVNALIDGVPEVALGNLMGGVLVLIGLLIGSSILMNRSIKTDGAISHIVPILAYLFLPFVFTLDGHVSVFDGLLMMLWYGWVMWYFFDVHHIAAIDPSVRPVINKQFPKDCLSLAVGMVVILLISNTIMRLSELALAQFNLSGFAVGFIVFALGTNVPELSIVIRSWKTKTKELTISPLIGSALANPFLIGFFAFLKPFTVTKNLFYYDFFLFSLLLFIAFGLFYRSGKKFTRTEGAILVAIYGCFFISEVILAILTHGG